MREIQDVSTQFLNWFQAEPDFIVCLPFFPAKRSMSLSVSSRSDHRVHIYSMDHGEYLEFSLDDPEPEGEGWVETLQAICFFMRDKKTGTFGFNAVIGGNIPLMAGEELNLGVQVLIARALSELTRVSWEPEKVKQFCLAHQTSPTDEEAPPFQEILDTVLTQVHILTEAS
jgi:galactokinase